MTTMTDARAVEVLAAMREDGGAVADADYTAAIDHVIARLREPAGVGWEFDAEAVAWAYGKLRGFGCYASEAGAMMGDRLNMMLLDPPAASPQPPAEAQPDEVVCLECGQPTMHIGQFCYACSHPAAKPAEAQAQGGGEVACSKCHDSKQEFNWNGDGPYPCRHCYTAPPSAPVGVEEAAEDAAAIDKAWDRFNAALTQQPASDGGFTAADMMDARQEGRKEAQQPAAVDGAMVERMVEAFLASTGQQHSVTQLQRDLTTECMKAALAAQPGGSDNDR